MNKSKDQAPVMGLVHSTESFGAVDGPGVRFIIFLKGCHMRCRYCHNVDTWDPSGATLRSPKDLLEQALRYRPYWGKKGGITVSGGEPLLQLPFLLELFSLAKEKGVHTCIDTSGEPYTKENPFHQDFERLLSLTDLFLLDIKEIDPDRHRALTGHGNENILEMARELSQKEKPVWIRHVLVPGVTDIDEDLLRLRGFLSTLHNIQRIEVLPYHSMGEVKWERLGIPYTLKGCPPPSQERIENARRILQT